MWKMYLLFEDLLIYFKPGLFSGPLLTSFLEKATPNHHPVPT
jgi:hypothetical protein